MLALLTPLSRPRWTWLAPVALLSLAACDGAVTEEDLQKWTHNDIGLARISEVVADPQQPLATRVRALEVVVEKNFPTRVRGMLDEIEDSRDEIVKTLVAELLDHVEKGDEHQYNSKDALMASQRYIAADDFAVLQQKVAAWAFGDIAWDTPGEDVKKKIESRITSGQISDLGSHGWEGAAILLSHGFVVDMMVEYLSNAKDAKATALLLRGIREHHERLGGVPYHHLEAIARTGSVEGLNYLLDVYLDSKHEKDIRTAAYNAANEMLEQPDLRKGAGSGGVVKKLLRLMESKQALDRWQGALNVVFVDGVEHLEDVLAAFVDDKAYGPADDPPPVRQVMDLCLDIYDGKHATKAVPVFMKHAQGGNRIVAAISIVCLKANQAHAATSVLQALAKPPGDASDVSLADFMGEGYSLGQLAGNALDGLAMMKEADAAQKAGSLGAFEAGQKKQLITFVLNQRGDAYKQQVEREFGEFLVDYKANPDKYREDQ